MVLASRALFRTTNGMGKGSTNGRINKPTKANGNTTRNQAKESWSWLLGKPTRVSFKTTNTTVLVN
jgi:hypothetical protein